MDSSAPILICVTPIKNESSNLAYFLELASGWADRIVLLDQCSTDNSLEIARRFEKVTILHNEAKEYDERYRAGRLIDAAREIAGRRIIFALDADEMLSANFRECSEWGRVLAAAPGTVIRMDRLGIHPDKRRYWVDVPHMPLGFVDDGSPFAGTVIHTTRIPLPPHAPVLELQDIKALHMAYLDVAKLESKVRWYQCWEALNGRKNPISSFRYYSAGLPGTVSPAKLAPIEDRWLDEDGRAWIEAVTRNQTTGNSRAETEAYWWDAQVIDWMRSYGTERFGRLPIWDADWGAIGEKLGLRAFAIKDPRTWTERAVHCWLLGTRSGPSAR